MKKAVTILLRICLGVVLPIMLLELSSCGGKGGDPAPATPSAQDGVKTKLLASNWALQSVTVDGVDQTTLYKGLTLKFSASTYTSTNGMAVWPASGSWTFGSTDGTSITRDDGLPVTLDVTETTLKLTLTWSKTTLGGGRLESIKGLHVFNMVK